MKTKIILFITGIAMLLSNCTSDVYNPDVCFQENVLPIFISNCTTSGCHDAVTKEHGFDFTTYEGIVKGVKSYHPLQSSVYTQCAGNKPAMPPTPNSPLSQKDLAHIKIWIKMGAINSSNCNKCDTSSFNFSDRVRPIINSWCLGCHQSVNTGGGGYDFSNYNGIVKSIANNSFIGAIDHTSGFSPMPKNGPKLNSCDLAAIKKWIDTGYPNN